MIIFRADGNSEIGVGHFMRCISIAKQLILEQQTIIFVVSKDSDTAILESHGISFYRLKQYGLFGWSCNEFVNWISCNCDKHDYVFLDSYRVTKDDMLEIRKYCKLVYLDDLVKFDYPVDIVINCNMDSCIQQYQDTEFKNRKVFCGSKFFPVREEFKEYVLNEVSYEVKRVFITSSSTDPFEAVYKILNEIKVWKYPNIEFYILEGLFYSPDYLDKLRHCRDRFDNVNLVHWGQNMAELLNKMDLTICPGSTVMLESFVVGIPCISYSFVDNHIALCKYCEKEKIAPYIGDLSKKEKDTSAGDLFAKLLSYQERKACFKKFRKEIDCNGCERISAILLDDMR